MDIIIIVSLILLGLLFCIVELLLLPGVTLGGLLSVACYGGAIYFAFENFTSVGGIIVVVSIILLTLVAVLFSLRAKTWDRFSLKSKIDSSSSEDLKSILAVGDRGVALSRLSPMGKIEIDGRSYEAKSNGAYIDAKEEIEVVGFENFSVVVKKRY